jgi:hypothetical protein
MSHGDFVHVRMHRPSATVVTGRLTDPRRSREETARRVRMDDLAAATIVYILGALTSKGYGLNFPGLHLFKGLTGAGTQALLPGPVTSTYGVDIGDPLSIGAEDDVEFLATARGVALALTSTRFSAERA